MSTVRQSTGLSRVVIGSTIERQAIALDARSIVALEWVQLWAQRNALLRLAPAAVVRRALVLLAEHLSRLEPEAIAGEGHRLREAAKGSGSAVSLVEARARFERNAETYRSPQMPGPMPLPHWRDALESPEARKESRRLLDSLEALMADKFPEKAAA